jgi:hypothetical protein
MRHFRKILLLFFLLSVANTVFAATVSLLDFQNDDVGYVDPRLPKFQTNFDHRPETKLDIRPTSSAPASAILAGRVLVQIPQYSFAIYCDTHHPGIKKRYLFTYSGTSPPSVS